MKGRYLVAVCAAGAMVVAGLAPTPSRAQSAGALLGGLAGGVLGGVIAGSMAAHAARSRPAVSYRTHRRPVRVVREVRRTPRHADRQALRPAAGPTGPQVVNATADPFAAPRGNAATTVNQAR